MNFLQVFPTIFFWRKLWQRESPAASRPNGSAEVARIEHNSEPAAWQREHKGWVHGWDLGLVCAKWLVNGCQSHLKKHGNGSSMTLLLLIMLICLLLDYGHWLLNGLFSV